MIPWVLSEGNSMEIIYITTYYPWHISASILEKCMMREKGATVPRGHADPHSRIKSMSSNAFSPGNSGNCSMRKVARDL